MYLPWTNITKNVSELLKSCKESLAQIVHSLNESMSHADIKNEVISYLPQGIPEDPEGLTSAMTAARNASVKDVLRPYLAIQRMLD